MSAASEAARLVTIPFSHYCEKARWALDRAAIAYVEDGHLPLFAYLPLRRLGARRTVPALVTGERTLIVDSTDILRWCDDRGSAPPLFPDGDREVAELEDDFDRHLGPASRRLTYSHLLTSKPMMRAAMGMNVPRWQTRVGRVVRPLAEVALRRGLRIDAAGAARSRAVIDRTFAAVAARLADGRAYLCGDRLTAADLTFAALAAPLLCPPRYAELVPDPKLVPSYQAMIAEMRATAAGQFALRVYERDRGATGGRVRS